MLGPILEKKEEINANQAVGQPSLQIAKYRLLTVLGILVTVMFFRHPAALSGAAGCFLFILLWTGVSLKTIVRRMLLIVPFGLGAILFIPFQVDGERLFTVLGYTASVEGVRHAEVILLKIVSANLLITYLLSVSPLFIFIKSLRAIGIPAILIEIISLMMRYFYLLKDEAQSMVKAQRSRGLRLDGWLWSFRAYKRFGELLGVLFLRAFGRSERIYLSITARGGFGDGPNVNNFDASKRRNRGMLEKNERCAAIEVRHAAYRYGSTLALCDVSFQVEQGAKVVLMGPNGAGKSTLISLLNGIEKDGRLLASGGVDLLFDDKLLMEADLHLPRLARPFRLLDEAGNYMPRTVREAAQHILKLMRKNPSVQEFGEKDETAASRDRR